MSRAGGTTVVSPALHRGEDGFHGWTLESRRDGAVSSEALI